MKSLKFFRFMFLSFAMISLLASCSKEMEDDEMEEDVVYDESSTNRDGATGDNDEDDTEDGDDPSVGSRADLDGDGIKEAVKLTVVPTADQHTMVIRATTDSDKKMGEVSIDVQKPQVVFTKATKLTFK